MPVHFGAQLAMTLSSSVKNNVRFESSNGPQTQIRPNWSGIAIEHRVDVITDLQVNRSRQRKSSSLGVAPLTAKWCLLTLVSSAMVVGSSRPRMEQKY